MEVKSLSKDTIEIPELYAKFNKSNSIDIESFIKQELDIITSSLNKHELALEQLNLKYNSLFKEIERISFKQDFIQHTTTVITTNTPDYSIYKSLGLITVTSIVLLGAIDLATGGLLREAANSFINMVFGVDQARDRLAIHTSRDVTQAQNDIINNTQDINTITPELRVVQGLASINTEAVGQTSQGFTQTASTVLNLTRATSDLNSNQELLLDRLNRLEALHEQVSRTIASNSQTIASNSQSVRVC